MSSKSENWRSTVKRKSMRSVTSTWNLLGWARKLTLKLESWERKRKDWEVILSMKKLNTKRKSIHLNPNLNTTSTLKLRTWRNNISIKCRLLTTKTLSWKKWSTQRTWRSSRFLLKIWKSRTTIKTQSIFLKNRMKTLKIKYLKLRD